jgi:hypothetical protein
MVGGGFDVGGAEIRIEGVQEAGMIQCKDCEYYDRAPDGSVILRCDPFSTIKEPECLQKWQYVRLERLSRAYESTLRMNQRLAPIQEKMIRYLEREIGEAEDADRWKYGLDDDDDSP